MIEYIKIAIGQLDYLDPILGLDLQEALAELSKGREGHVLYLLKTVRAECRDRAYVHDPGTLRAGWANVTNALNEAIKELS